ncbi:RNA-guided endonuclease TnpB family protein [Actinoallomurus acanthiterrae]
MKVVVQVKLMPTPVQAAALKHTLRTVNEAACWVSDVAFECGVPREYELRKHTYAQLKERGLGSQVAQHVIKKVRDAYTSLHANLRAGNLGKKGSKRWAQAMSKAITFRPQAAHPFDDRCLSWQYDAQTVSIWTMAGRLKDVRFACSPNALKQLITHRKGESDLVERGGVFYLIATCEVPEADLREPGAFVGVDLGIVNIATTSTGYRAAGRKLNRYRRRQVALRAKLQKKGTKSAKRLLAKQRRKESRRAKDINHRISRTIVTEAERTGRGISLEQLTGIRERVRLRKPQRVALHTWAFAQLADFIVYKARRAGVPVVFVDPAWSSRQCAECGHIDRLNRVSQALFTCRGCGVVAHADRNASRVLARRGREAWDAGRKSHVPTTSPQKLMAKTRQTTSQPVRI